MMGFSSKWISSDCTCACSLARSDKTRNVGRTLKLVWFHLLLFACLLQLSTARPLTDVAGTARALTLASRRVSRRPRHVSYTSLAWRQVYLCSSTGFFLAVNENGDIYGSNTFNTADSKCPNDWFGLKNESQSLSHRIVDFFVRRKTGTNTLHRFFTGIRGRTKLVFRDLIMTPVISMVHKMLRSWKAELDYSRATWRSFRPAIRCAPNNVGRAGPTHGAGTNARAPRVSHACKHATLKSSANLDCLSHAKLWERISSAPIFIRFFSSQETVNRKAHSR